MSLRGDVLTFAGCNLCAKLSATAQPLVLSRVMFGTGKAPEGATVQDFKKLQNLYQPFAPGTSTTPVQKDNTVSMILQFRSDLNGGLKKLVWLNEYGVFAQDPDGGEVLLLYGNLGDAPESVLPLENGQMTAREYPVTWVIGSDVDIVCDFNAGAFLTSQTAADLVEAALRRAVAMKGLSVNIPVKAWKDTKTGRYPFVADIQDTRIKEIHYPDVALGSDSMAVAVACGFSPTVTALDGVLRFYAQKKPTAAILADCRLFKEGKDDAILMFDLPVATTDILGAIKASDNVVVSEDGKARVELTNDNFVSDAELNTALNTIFGSN